MENRGDWTMSRRLFLILGFSILFVFFIQTAGMLVESIYILDLLKSSLDAKVLGVLFFFSPIFLLPFGKRAPGWFIWIAFGLLIVGRGVAPYLNTPFRLLATGVGTSGALLLIPILFTRLKPIDDTGTLLAPAQGLALGIGLSILLRTLNYTIDFSLTTTGGWISWVLAVMLGLCLTQFPTDTNLEIRADKNGLTSAGVGVVAVLTLMYFAFASPGVIVRWTEGNYQVIIMMVSFLTLLWLFVSLGWPDLLSRVKPPLLIGWNLLFTLSLITTMLAHTIRFPASLSSPEVIVGAPLWYQQVPLALLLLLFPVLFIDFGVFSRVIARCHPSPRDLVTGFMVGAIFMVILIFMNIFTNVWGYVRPVSLFFRNKYWLPYLLLSGVITISIFYLRRDSIIAGKQRISKKGLYWSGAALALIMVIILTSALLTDRIPAPGLANTSLKVMTYNIQQANDVYGEKSYDRQIALIRQVDPDVVALQETDSSRISLNNNDIIRYYANKLGYYSYYGPKTVTGTYGTAILSKYPLKNTLTFFTYSDKDEAGTAEADIEVGDKTITLFSVHPDESDPAMLVFARTLLARAQGKPQIIAMGDYNLRSFEEAYKLIDSVFKNAWISVYPTGIDKNGVDMSGDNRIDHIFVSPSLNVNDPVYILPPASETDHPVHWATIFW
jgi:endonuclease/exonuclease/phosphatase family metal-dependent hydrolase